MINGLDNNLKDGEQQNTGELLRTLEELKSRVEKLESKRGLSVESSLSEISDFKELLSDVITDTLWDNVFYIASMDGPSVTTSSGSEVFNSSTRQADTSSEKYLSPAKPSRFRCHFYFNGTDATIATAYIGSFGTSTLSSGITSINQSDMEYVALKISSGVVTIDSKSTTGTSSAATGITITDDTTYKLEIDYFPHERAVFYLNDKIIGSVTKNIPIQIDPVTFFPLMVSLTRTSGTNVTVTVESWEFIQERE